MEEVDTGLDMNDSTCLGLVKVLRTTHMAQVSTRTAHRSTAHIGEPWQRKVGREGRKAEKDRERGREGREGGRETELRGGKKEGRERRGNERATDEGLEKWKDGNGRK